VHQRKQQVEAGGEHARSNARRSKSSALLFQSILMEERIPAAFACGFARLQMPVLRVAVASLTFRDDRPSGDASSTAWARA